jgi:tyramine---L-glutamate ligase
MILFTPLSMPRILIYEECLAAGSQGPLGDEAVQFLPEGLAMTLAVAEDFAKMQDWTVKVLRAVEFRTQTIKEVAWQWIDVSGDLMTILAREAAAADWTLVIAPECGGILQQRAQAVVDVGGKLLGPSPEFIKLASNKTMMSQLLAEHCIRVPQGLLGTLEELSAWKGPLPAVIKPNDGVGASDVRRVLDRTSLLGVLQDLALLNPSRRVWRCEEFIPGQSASVAILSGGTNLCLLQPMTQALSFDFQGRASYNGGCSCLTAEQQTRAQIWAVQVWAVMPISFGYVGVDLILGDAPDGSQDCVLEVNPRLTTSYIGLRRATHQSLADAMWRIAQGETVNIAWLPNIVEFTKQGQVSLRERS